MRSETTIREWQVRDKQNVMDLILPIQREEFGIAITEQDQPDLQTVEAFYQHGDGNFWVAVDDDMIIGTVALIDIGDNEVALRKMFVRTDYRGKEKMVAQQLLDTVFEWCRQRGVNNIYLGTINVYKAAQRFYEKNGFRQVAKEELPERFPLMAVDDTFYVYTLL
jgi:N-acetylglutamate synthase-like GNAT family acetyltransferase